MAFVVKGFGKFLIVKIDRKIYCEATNRNIEKASHGFED